MLTTKETRAAYMRKWRRENPEKNRKCREAEKHTPSGKARRAAWNVSFECKVHRKLSKHRKRAEAYGLTEHFTYLEAMSLWARQCCLCRYCGKLLDMDGLWHFEHIKSIGQGGMNTIENIVLSCPECNIQKARSNGEFKHRG